MSKAKTERYDVTVQGGGHGMTTDALDGLEQLRRIIDEQPEPAPESVMLGLDYCYAEWVAERARHAEEVARLEAAHLSDLETIEAWKLASGLECGGDPDGVTPAGMRRYWEGVEADRDSLRDQLRKVEGERDALAVRMDLPASQLLMVGSELCGDGKIDPNDHRDPRWTPTLQQAAKVMRELTSIRALLPDVRACAEWMRDELIEGHELQTLGCRILAVLDSQGGEGE